MIEFERSVIKAQAPVRFDFGGGPTDVDPFKSQEGGYVVNAAVKQLAHIAVTQQPDGQIVVYSRDYNIEEKFDSIQKVTLNGPLRLLKAAIIHTKPTTGLRIETQVDVPPGSGLGGSASLSIALLGALKAANGESTPDALQLVDDALYIENVMLKNINGGQDQYAAALGGLHSFTFNGENVAVRSLNVRSETITQLEERSVLCYTGEPHISGDILTTIMKNYTQGEEQTVHALHEMKALATSVEEAIVKGNIDEFGKLIREIGIRQRNYHPDVQPQYVRELLDYAEKHGAIGGKLAGAGGGGALYLFCQEGKKAVVQDALAHYKTPIIPMQFATNGVAVWYE